MINQHNSTSPFMEEQKVSETNNKVELFKPSYLPRDSEGAPKRASFLPLEVFDPKPEIDPASLIVAYADPESGKCYGLSKWVF